MLWRLVDQSAALVVAVPTRGEHVDGLRAAGPTASIVFEGSVVQQGDLHGHSVRDRPTQPFGTQRIVSHEKFSSEVVMRKVMPVVLASVPLFVMLTAMFAG